MLRCRGTSCISCPIRKGTDHCGLLSPPRAPVSEARPAQLRSEIAFVPAVAAADVPFPLARSSQVHAADAAQMVQEKALQLRPAHSPVLPRDEPETETAQFPCRCDPSN